MNGEFSRRQFVAGAMAASCAVLQPGAVLGQSVPQAGRTLDIHVHLFGKGDSAPVWNIELANPKKLVVALDQGCTVIACHCGTGRQSDRPDMLPDFLEMLRKHKNLWGDTSVLGGIGRVRDFLRLLAHHEARERLLHGSDFPFPAIPLAFTQTLGLKNAFRLQTIENSLTQDLALKEALGIGRASAERAYRLICGQAD